MNKILKIISISMVLASSIAFAQNYPSTTVKQITITGSGSTGDVSSMSVKPGTGNVSTALSQLIGRISSPDDFGAVHDGTTNDLPAINRAIKYLWDQGGGTLYIGPYPYKLSGTIVPAMQPTTVQYNPSGFTLSGITNAQTYYRPGMSVRLSGFAAPFGVLNGDWRIASVGSTSFVVLTGLSGTQNPSSVGSGVVSENLTIPDAVKVLCNKGMAGQPIQGKSWRQTPYTLVLDSNTTIGLHKGLIQGCNIVSNAVADHIPYNATLRANINIVKAFTGTGISVRDDDATISDVFVGGFSLGVDSYRVARLRINGLYVDSTQCVKSDHSHDISRFHDIHCFPFIDYHTGQNFETAITGIADNGSGLWRISLDNSLGNLIAGDLIYIRGVVGPGAINNSWTIASATSSYIDLLGSSTAATQVLTATTVNQSFCVKAVSVSDMVNIGIGDAVSGTGVQAGSKITRKYPRQGAFCLDKTFTASNTGVSLTITPAAYTSGGTVRIDSTRREGYGLSWTNGETNSCANCFVLGHKVGFYMGAASAWTTLTDAKVDTDQLLQWQDSVGFWIDDSAVGTNIIGGSTQSVYVPLLVTGTNVNQAHQVHGVVLNGTGSVLEMSGGRLSLIGNSNGMGNSSAAYVGDSTTFLAFTNNDFGIQWYFSSATPLTKVFVGGNSLKDANTFGGMLLLPGEVNLGGGGTACVQFSNCGVTLNGPQKDGSASSGSYGSYFIPGNVGSWLFSAAATVPSYNIQLPSPSTGLRMQIAFSQAITTATWSTNAGTVYSPYTSITQGQLVICQAWSTTWYCK